jgi:phosphoglycerate-specific signal transduction histidine kinase
MSIYAANIKSSGVDQVLSDAESNVDGLVSQQTQYYETQISETDPTLLEEATIKTQLSQLKRLSGDTDEADQLQDEADAAFEEYTETVAEAEQEVQNGDETWNEMQQNKFTVVIGQPLLLNPIEFGSVRTQIEEFDDSYTAAISALETAGAESRAESVSTEYNSRSNRLLIAQISLFVLFGGLIATIIGIIAWTTRQMYQYAEDSEETVSGDFLLT